MRYALALAAIPVVVWAAWPTPSPPIAAKAVATEGIRAVRQDDSTFRARWRPLYDLPPAIVVHEVVTDLLPTVMSASTDRQEVARAGITRIDTARPRPRIVRRVSLRGDVCSRHGMRKVWTHQGRWPSWRCRR